MPSVCRVSRSVSERRFPGTKNQQLTDNSTVRLVCKPLILRSRFLLSDTLLVYVDNFDSSLCREREPKPKSPLECAKRMLSHPWGKSKPYHVKHRETRQA